MEDAKKRGGFLSLEDLKFIDQMMISLEQAELKLEQAYKRKKPNQFDAVKKFILNLNKKINDSFNR